MPSKILRDPSGIPGISASGKSPTRIAARKRASRSSNRWWRPRPACATRPRLARQSSLVWSLQKVSGAIRPGPY